MTQVFLTVVLIVGAPAPKEVKPSPPSLLGEWLVSTVIESGENTEDGVGSTLSFTANGKCSQYDGKKKPEVMKFTANAKRETAEIDITLPGDGMEGVVYRGIYKIDGNELTICLCDEGDRPREFVSLMGKSVFLITLIRMKKDK